MICVGKGFLFPSDLGYIESPTQSYNLDQLTYIDKNRDINGMRKRSRQRYRSPALPVLNTKQGGKLHHRIIPTKQYYKRDYSDLPEDLVSKIVAALSPRSLKAASSVCNCWHDALRQAREDLKYVEYITMKAKRLGNTFKQGSGGFKPNSNNALCMFLEAAKYGSRKGMMDAGKIYWERGETDKALGWFRRAAELGDLTAQRNLGIAYCNVKTRNLDEAIKWLTLASLGGDARAQHQLSICLRDGGDNENAARWSLRSAQGGYVRAMCSVAMYYMKGLGFAQCDRQAREWMKLAADQGYAKAQYLLQFYP